MMGILNESIEGIFMKVSHWIVSGFFVVLSFPSFAMSQEVVSAKVIRVVDGDTLVMFVGERREWIDLIAIDAPEAVQPWGMVAFSALKALVDGKDIRIEFDIEKRNPEGRLWGYLWAGDTFINRELVLNGYALWDYWPPNNLYDDDLINAEFQARKEWRGMWKSPVPTNGDAQFRHE